jgi:serpin B
MVVLLVSSAPAGEKTDDINALVEGNNEFAFDLYGILKKEDGNIFFSPYSISSALGMTYGGARGNTALEMEKALNFTLGNKATHPAFAQLNDRLEDIQKSGDVQLAVANSLWPQKDYTFLPEYISLTKKHYGAKITALDFKGDTEGSRKVINKWVEDKTRDRIKDLIARGVLDPMTRLVLVNAIYFKGNWEHQFKAERTEKKPFITRGGKVRVPMMTQTRDFNYAETDGVQLLELPYVGNELSMLVILPKENVNLADVERELTAERLESWKNQLRMRKVRVLLPKFKMTWGAFEMSAALKALGMVDAFSGKADFSGMDGTHWLSIAAVLHKAFVEVNEEGTEAAAATAVVMGLTAVAAPPPVFNADHPFLFLIQEKETGSILFMGRVMDPSE